MKVAHNSLVMSSRRFAVVALVALCGGAIAAPSGSAKDARTSASLTSVTYVGPRAGTVACMAIGKRLGYFKREGINLNINFNIPVAQTAANVLSGNAQFGGLGWAGVLPAASNGVPLVVIGQVSAGGSASRKDDSELVTLASSSIKTPADLKGKTIAVPILGGVAEIAIRNLAVRNKIGQRDFKLAQVNFPDMAAALRAGRVDAAMMLEPFVALLKAQAPVRLVTGQSDAIIGKGGLGGLVTFTSRAYLESHKDVVDAFRRAQERSIRYAQRNPKRVAELLPGILNLTPKVVSTMIPSTCNSTVDFKQQSRYVTLAYNFGKVSKKIDPRTIAVLK